MATEPKFTITELSDGRVYFSRPRHDGPTAVEFQIPGELGTVLDSLAYRARIVIDRVDGGAITERDRELLHEAVTAAARGTGVRDAIAAKHLAQAPGLQRAETDDTDAPRSTPARKTRRSGRSSAAR